MTDQIRCLRLPTVLCLTLGLVVGCGKGNESAPQTGAQSGSDSMMHAAPEPMPDWVKSQAQWPDTIRWTMDSTYEYKRDDLTLRIRAAMWQDISNQRFQNEKPLICEVVTTMSRVPKWEDAKGFKVDSVVVGDPVNHRAIRPLHMLAFQRGYEKQTVRTRFLANQGDADRQSPDLVEGQRLDLTVYMTWDKRHLIAMMPPETLGFVRNPSDAPKPEEIDPAYPTNRATPGGGR